MLDEETESLRVPAKTLTWRNYGSHVAMIRLKDKYNAQTSYYQDINV